MRDLGTLLADLAALGINDLVTLVEIDARDAIGHYIRRCDRLWDNGWDGTFRGETYTPDALAFDNVEEGTDGKRPGFMLRLQNVRANTPKDEPVYGPTTPWSNLVVALDNELNGSHVRLVTTRIATIIAGNEDDVWEETLWYVDGGELVGNDMSVRCGPPSDAFSERIPKYSITSETCGWTYGLNPCTNLPHQNGYPTCPRDSVDACIARTQQGQPIPWGPGFPLFVKASRRRI